MAGLHAWHSPCRNPRLASKNELAGAAPIEGSGTPTPTPVVSHAPTPAPATAFAIALSLHNELFKQFMKACFKAWVPAQIAPEIDFGPCK